MVAPLATPLMMPKFLMVPICSESADYNPPSNTDLQFTPQPSRKKPVLVEKMRLGTEFVLSSAILLPAIMKEGTVIMFSLLKNTLLNAPAI